MRQPVRFLVVALLIWLIPFLVSLPFFNRDGQLMVNFWVFKGVMAVVLSGGAFLLFRWLMRSWAPAPRRTTAVILGLGAVVVSIALDSLTVIPLTQMGLGEYLAQIVSLYTLIILMGLAARPSQP